jgi:hypothetical protein
VLLPVAVAAVVEVPVTDPLGEMLPTVVSECVLERDSAAEPDDVPVPPPAPKVPVAHAVGVLQNVAVLDGLTDTEGAGEVEGQGVGDAVRAAESVAEVEGVKLARIEAVPFGVPLAVLVAHSDTVNEGTELPVGETLEVPVLRCDKVGVLDALENMEEEGVADRETVPLGDALLDAVPLTLALPLAQIEGLGDALEDPVVLDWALDEREILLDSEAEGEPDTLKEDASERERIAEALLDPLALRSPLDV